MQKNQTLKMAEELDSESSDKIEKICNYIHSSDDLHHAEELQRQQQQQQQ